MSRGHSIILTDRSFDWVVEVARREKGASYAGGIGSAAVDGIKDRRSGPLILGL
jgi:hypothetical protein